MGVQLVYKMSCNLLAKTTGFCIHFFRDFCIQNIKIIENKLGLKKAKGIATDSLFCFCDRDAKGAMQYFCEAKIPER